MNGEGSPGRAEEDLRYLRGEFVTSIDFGSPYPGGFYPDISLGFLPSLPQTFFELPPILYGPPVGGEGNGDSATPGPDAVSPVVVDPGQGTQTTVFEDAPGGIYQTNRAPTDWDRVYREYVVLNAPEADVGLFEGVDWGSVAGTIVGGLFDPFGAGAAVQTAFAPPQVVGGLQTVPQMGGPPGVQAMTPTSGGCPPVGPKYAKICLATREITPLRRRRRRRLLTSSDIKDLAALKAIVGGAALQGAVVQAIRR